MNARLIHPGDPEFPSQLVQGVPDKDVIRRLWVLGRDLREMLPALAIVGSRRATRYGLEVARGIAADLAALGVCIVSGMALGIDGIAHEGALSVRGRTIAVLGSGVNVPYPARNRDLYRRIVATGSIVSEQPLGEPARKQHFKARNRIIAALAEGVVLVQANGEKSGAMGTVDHALRFGRTGLAVPGDVRSSLSSGPHALLRDGATLVACAGDVVESLGERLGVRRGVGGSGERWEPPEGLEPEEKAVLAAVSADPAGADEVIARTGAAPATVLRVLGALELRGLIARNPSGTLRRIR